jgi:hypothetical protein
MNSESSPTPIPPESLRWLAESEYRAEKEKSPDPMVRLFACQFKPGSARPPEWFLREMEYQFRRGYYWGHHDSVEKMQQLTKLGYQRPREIGNILCKHLNRLRNWMREAFTDGIDARRDEDLRPDLEQESWFDLRRKTFARDGGKCLWCDSPEELEAHHEIPVCEGGLPELKNLKTLCAKCHRGKPDPDEPDGLSDEQAEILIQCLDSVTGYPWSWCDCEPRTCGARWQLMPLTTADEDDFWDWHVFTRRQFFNNRVKAVEYLMRSHGRWTEMKSLTPAKR